MIATRKTHRILVATTAPVLRRLWDDPKDLPIGRETVGEEIFNVLADLPCCREAVGVGIQRGPRFLGPAEQVKVVVPVVFQGSVLLPAVLFPVG